MNQSLLHVTISSCVSLIPIATIHGPESIANHVTTDSRVSFEPYVTILHINSITYFVTIVLRVSFRKPVTIPFLNSLKPYLLLPFFMAHFLNLLLPNYLIQ